MRADIGSLVHSVGPWDDFARNPDNKTDGLASYDLDPRDCF